LPSKANFILQHTLNVMQASWRQLREQGIIVRYFNKPRINQYLRITVGTMSKISVWLIP
jgi:histidinol-phosphate aminotransferase